MRFNEECVMQSFLFVVVIWALVGTIGAIWMNRRALARFWREPVLRRPVLIIESDDWGAGPPVQARRLEAIAAVLASHADFQGRTPVMTLGLVLGVADGVRIVADKFQGHHRTSLADPALAPVLAAIRSGAERGVFALQLHGGEHYWPLALLVAARRDPQVAAWLREPEIPRTEGLPEALQSRWIDASALPAKALPVEESRAAAFAEAGEFRSIFGREPTVAVPPTFVWNDFVEAAWAEAGVRFVVTPGRRYETRSADGEPVVPGPDIVNGDRGTAGITYVVRDDYFEPMRGHKAEGALVALAAKARLGRPALLEMHRANFLGDAEGAKVALGELDRLLELTTRTFPGVAFLSTEELAERIRRTDPSLVERKLASRLHVWLRRVWRLPRMRKLAWASGAIVPGTLMYALTYLAVPRSSGR